MKVRVVVNNGKCCPTSEIWHTKLSNDEAKSWFKFYVDCAVDLSMTSVYVVNLISNNNKTIFTFLNLY